MAANLLVLFAATALAAAQLAAAQDVDVRTGGDKVSPDGGQSSRTVYSQRHLSPHRMMHFGKKAEQRQAASFYEPLGYPQPARRLARQIQAPPALFPMADGLSMGPNNEILLDGRPLLTSDVTRYAMMQPVAFSLETINGQELVALPDQADGLLPYDYSRLQLPAGQFRFFDPTGKVQDRDLKVLVQAGALPQVSRQKAIKEDPAASISMRLMEAAEEKKGNIEQVGEQPEQQQAGGAISVDTRSRQTGLASHSTIEFPSQWFDRLYNRGSSLRMNFKKAEPKENLFMHFGRK